MSKDEYYVEPDGDGDPTLWESDTQVLTLMDDGNALILPSRTRHDAVVWRAAVSVLVDDEETVELVAAAIHEWNPLPSEPWEKVEGDYRDARLGQARAALAALRDRAVSS